MSVTSEILFAYLREVFYAKSDAKLEVEKLEEDYVTFAKGLMFLAHCFAEYNEFAEALAKGDLSLPAPPPENELAAPLKSLQASLKHLTWQSQQVAKGDYNQRVDFMGEFADGFNTMVEQLADRQHKLENEILQSKKHAQALEQSNLLLRNLTHYIPQQIFVVDLNTHDLLLYNSMAKVELEYDPGYISKLMSSLPDHSILTGRDYVEISFDQAGAERFLAINAYLIQWNHHNAIAMILKDISEEKKQRRQLEDQAFHDSLTGIYNRFFGMLTLNDWLDSEKPFALVFVDLDNLKYVNDVFGHSEGDEYIIRASRHLQNISKGAIVCRLGGDEFMALIPDVDQAGVTSRMAEISHAIENDEYLHGRGYRYSVSVGVVSMEECNSQPASLILRVADERMYEQKRARKKARSDAAQQKRAHED